MSKVLSWGKCRLATKKKDGAKWYEWTTPVENSTGVDPTKGEKKEAKIEGGENEAVKYAKTTYVLNTSIRLGAGDKKPVKDADGVVEGEYSVIVIPENITAPGLYIENATISLEDDFTTDVGVILNYAFDALAATFGDQLKVGTFTMTGGATDIGSATALSFTPIGNEEDSTVPSAIKLIGT